MQRNIFKHHSISFSHMYSIHPVERQFTIHSSNYVAAFVFSAYVPYILTRSYNIVVSRKLSQREKFQEGLRGDRYMEGRLIDVRQFLLKRRILIRDARMAQRPPKQATAITA